MSCDRDKQKEMMCLMSNDVTLTSVHRVWSPVMAF